MSDWLAAPVVPLAWCWRIERTDGVTIGLTTHDRALAIDGLTYRPEPGMRPSAIVQKAGLGGSSFDVAGALTSAALRADDLAAGRWDGARVTLSVADWQAPEARVLTLADGRLGSVAVEGGRWVAELAAREPELLRPCAPETSAECRAELGDRDCRVTLATHGRAARVTSVAGDVVGVDRALTADMFAFGALRWLDGPARGLRQAVAANDAGSVTLIEAARGGVGARVELTAGCDKRAATCAARFANIANFRGEPHLPGIDLLTRYPGG